MFKCVYVHIWKQLPQYYSCSARWVTQKCFGFHFDFKYVAENSWPWLVSSLKKNMSLGEMKETFQSRKYREVELKFRHEASSSSLLHVAGQLASTSCALAIKSHRAQWRAEYFLSVSLDCTVLTCDRTANSWSNYVCFKIKTHRQPFMSASLLLHIGEVQNIKKTGPCEAPRSSASASQHLKLLNCTRLLEALCFTRKLSLFFCLRFLFCPSTFRANVYKEITGLLCWRITHHYPAKHDAF